ncbi:phospholipase D1 [Sodiomyces alkalinus F11]|uniref:Phospholipase D1 n=1 Tax=Sodiomyces alkalinus (strain CBS 110278 / VKM F-3762 / F11) TaxID=1314773 RepID=A0A3N2PLZ7_SODAK|nr:phospholipase D1 [Sodiomyces alkalinus F11]ROT35499.1 phospholipase D1 [Sodiomyces alkalinus F11]
MRDQPRRDESISPGSTGVRPEPPSISSQFGSPTNPPDLTNEVDGIPEPNSYPTPPEIPATVEETQEALDYMNGGAPHRHHSPLSTDGTRPPIHSVAWPAPGDVADKSEQATMEQDNGDNAEMASPLGRRSVQFARADVVLDPPLNHSRNPSWDDAGKSLSSAFMSKLKQITGTGGLQTPRGSDAATPNDTGGQSLSNSPTVARAGWRIPGTLHEEGSDADADAEETADEGAVADPNKVKKKKKRMMRRPRRQLASAPSTPDIRHTDPDGVMSQGRFGFRRRLSMPDDTEHQHGVSEGEGRDQLMAPSWMRGASWMGSASRFPRDGSRDTGSPSTRGPGHTRRITVFGGGGVSDGDAMTPRRTFFGGDRATTFGAHKWKQVKNTLKLLRQKKEDRFDFAKSAELMAELRAGAPAALMLASMIQRDEHGNKRIPVLLEQVRLRVRDSAPEPDDDSERHWVFTMDLEYGSGPSRMKWTVIRTVRDIYNLHVRYKFAMSNDKYFHGRADVGSRPKQPKFPWAAFPYLRGARFKGDSEEDDGASTPGEEAPESHRGQRAAGDETADETDGRPHNPRKKSRLEMFGMRRRSTGFTDPGEASALENRAEMMQSRRRYVERQRRVLEKYMQDMIRWLMFRADSNRLCKFLELSALGVRLAAEGSYHGKECYLHIQSSKGLDFRRVLTPKKVIARHSRKWFLVRSSYIVCVESPENMLVYDVYLVDPKFRIVSKKSTLKQIGSKDKKKVDLTKDPAPDKHHTVTLHTSERKVKLFSRNQSVMRQFEDSIAEMLKQTAWHYPNRFDSFAPVRQGVFAQWLVDGRDYMWNVSRAISMARDVIYIHDWWLSPELYMRRPPAISQKWRLDRLLQRKAREGVKVFIIVYRNVEAAIPIDSEYTKHSLLNLHPNIFVQRSPNQFKKNQFFFAHHEKLCVIDHDIAFVGGIDLCFGRWDCPQHPCIDDKPTGFEQSEHPKDAQHCQLFPGKDYSNPRVQDFFKLSEPYEEMYDRSKVPRMPWHDIGMQVVGQPARDLTRHFVQRWNYIRRGRTTTRPLPFLLPPPEVKSGEMESLGLNGTCEVQILRSAGNWSLGLDEPEYSIQNAYIKLIEDSEHLVYMENQFFITSTEVMNTQIVNRIGDALVQRIIRAHEKDEDWKAYILIPLMPGFQNSVDEQEGTSVRLILQCQYYSICRGENSIFGRLRAMGIEPEDYIQFYSLRQWGKMSNGSLVTEQLYIHAKCIIVDDRVALIGSANINERSMRGDRDSELAAVVRDTDMIWSTMAGKPYRVGRFAHTLRLRLMREHLGLDVDEILEEERQAELDREAEYQAEMEEIYRDGHAERGSPSAAGPSDLEPSATTPIQRRPLSRTRSVNYDAEAPLAEVDGSDGERKEADPRVTNNSKHALEVEGYGPDHWKAAQKAGLDVGRDSIIINNREVLVHDIHAEGKGTLESPKRPRERRASPVARTGDEDHESVHDKLPPMPPLDRRTTDQLGLPRLSQLPKLPNADDTDIGGPPVQFDATGRPINDLPHPRVADIRPAHIDKNCMRDPVNSSFMDEIWNRVAENNTKIMRRVFRCMPDSEVLTWTDYRDYDAYSARFRASMEGKKFDEPNVAPHADGPPSSAGGGGAGMSIAGPGAMTKTVTEKAGEKTHAAKVLEHLHVPKTAAQTAGRESEMDEKAALGHTSSHENEKTRCVSSLSIDPEKAAGQPDPMEAPSPALPAGEVPFPSLEGAELSASGTVGSSPEKAKDRHATFSPTEQEPRTRDRSTSGQQAQAYGSIRRRRRATTKGSRRGGPPEDILPAEEAEELLSMVQGNLVKFPYDWLLTEEQNGNWGFQVDGVAPLQIYN